MNFLIIPANISNKQFSEYIQNRFSIARNRILFKFYLSLILLILFDLGFLAVKIISFMWLWANSVRLVGWKQKISEAGKPIVSRTWLSSMYIHM